MKKAIKKIINNVFHQHDYKSLITGYVSVGYMNVIKTCKECGFTFKTYQPCNKKSDDTNKQDIG